MTNPPLKPGISVHSVAAVLLFAMAFGALAPAHLAADLRPASLADFPLYRIQEILERSEDGGVTWFAVRGLPVRDLPPDLSGQTAPLTAFTVNPGNSREILAATGNRLHHSTSSGAAWIEIGLDGTINESTYITAVAIHPDEPGVWAAGTSYDGIYLTGDGGTTWSEVWSERNRGPLYLGAGFYEEVSELEFAEQTLAVQAGYGSGFATVDLATGESWKLRPFLSGRFAYRVPRLPERIVASRTHEPADADAVRRRAAASDKTGIYVAAANATPDKLESYFDLMERQGFNSIVVDVKDDFGKLTYETSLEMPRVVGAVEPILDLPKLVRTAHERDIYVIARVVLFKDRALYRFENNRFAYWDGRRDAPWGVFRTITDEETGESRVVQVEYWVDANSPEVRDYNLRIAEEVAGFGVDEIQFDYVRFPSDGNTAAIESRFAPDGYDRVETLETFLSEARRRISIPIGIDVFGFNAWTRMSYLGQDIHRLAKYVDVISPMSYPSHFARAFLPNLTYFERSRVIYDYGTRRAREMAGDVLIRPYIQAFLIGPELEFTTPEYQRYLQIQIEGAAAAGSDGFTLWNASGRYYMLK